MERQVALGGRNYVVDNLCNPARHVGLGSSEQLHLRRFHTHIVGSGGDRLDLPVDHGAPRGLTSSRFVPYKEGNMDKDTIKGKMDDIKGRVKRQAGEWTGDEKLQDEGAM